MATLSNNLPIIELKVYKDGHVTLECAGATYTFPSLGCKEEAVEEEMLRNLMTYMDDAGKHASDSSLHATWLLDGWG